MIGKIVAVCTSELGGIPKRAQPTGVIGKWGLYGDFHNREMRPSFSQRGVLKPNDRHISIVALEVLVQLGCAHVGRALGPGELAENITVDGLGDLSQIPNGARLMIGDKVWLRVTEQNQPCKHVRAAYGLKFYEAVRGRRGLLCTIERGFGEPIHQKDPIQWRMDTD
jgi:hypothetical protein